MKAPSKYADKVVKINSWANEIGGRFIKIEDWWENVAGKSWMHCDSNPACVSYGMRSGFSGVPIPVDNDVLYGKIGGYGCLVHLSEIEGEGPKVTAGSSQSEHNS